MRRVAFTSPMAAPNASAASGAGRMSALLVRAIEVAGFEVMLPAVPRAYEGRGDAALQLALRDACERRAAELIETYRGGQAKPDLWFSYHVYYKSPDWIGPAVSRALQIPYLIAEGSYAPKRAGGPWAVGHEGATAALTAADRLFAMTRFDRVCLDQLAPGHVRDLKPFIDVREIAAAMPHDGTVHLVTVAMMRNERKRASYALLAEALTHLRDVPLRLTIAGDGSFRADIEAMFERHAAHDVRFIGAVAPDRVAALLASGDIFAWPGLGEAYGLAFLEAQAAALPVVACNDRGVPDATFEGETTLLSAPNDATAYAANLRRLIGDLPLRRRFSKRARAFVRHERSVEAAAQTLRDVFAELRT